MSKHVTVGFNSVRYLHCGREQEIAMPCSVNVYKGICEGFTEDHRHCEPSPAGKARFEYSTPEEWLRSWDAGTSALTIYNVLRGGVNVLRDGVGFGSHGPDIPYDPADFGRCYRLLEVAPPSWRESLRRVAERHPAWQPFVDAWDELTALYEAEAPTGYAPGLYKRMQELVAVSRALGQERSSTKEPGPA